ncbi:anthranilate phosphoribosyltransferase [[Candida] anglica]|uniref:Anthranilate phosphoribosyltransferase n=1 Tax=[Candida] anglica TaxID=148631 RepID=A0ABP0E8D4_9ASCO
MSSVSAKNVLTPYIKSLFLERPNLTPEDLATVLKFIFRGIPSEAQTAAFLTALRMRGVDHQPEFIAAAVRTILEFSTVIDPSKVSSEGYVDIVGTGGDGQNTFNVSTSAAIVAAGAGLPVCKHGGKASTSTSGSGDLLKSLGVDLMQVTSTTVPEIVPKSNFCFLFAPAFHPGMGKVASIRGQLGIPTIFNILGPLINPIPLKVRVLGVYSEALGEAYAQAAAQLAVDNKTHQRTIVVFGEVGLDEVAPCGSTKLWIVESDGTITKQLINPLSFNLPEHSLEDVKSGTPEENAAILMHILRQDNEKYLVEGAGNDPIVDYILLNTALLIYATGKAESLQDGVLAAKKSITSGSALREFEKFKAAIEATKD